MSVDSTTELNKIMYPSVEISPGNCLLVMLLITFQGSLWPMIKCHKFCGGVKFADFVLSELLSQQA